MVEGFGSRVHGFGFWVSGLGFRVQGSGLKVEILCLETLTPDGVAWHPFQSEI